MSSHWYFAFTSFTDVSVSTMTTWAIYSRKRERFNCVSETNIYADMQGHALGKL